jgi:two-component system, NarL family, invasion response regulator UvrY
MYAGAPDSAAPAGVDSLGTLVERDPMIRVLIADDHPIVREGIRRILERAPDVAVVAEAGDADGVLRVLDGARPDVLLLDVAMPGPGFLELLAAVGERAPRARVLVVSAHPEDQFAVRALRAGAAGYLSKGHEPAELLEAVRRVHAGRRFISPDLAEKLVAELDRPAGREGHHRLSRREFEVLCLIGEGLSLKEIGARLEVNPKTISSYRARILEKLELKNTADLIRYALAHGLLS